MPTPTLERPLPAAVAAPRLRGFLSDASEVDALAVRVDGRWPVWLAGTYLLNGPALYDFPGGSYVHWFDGLAKLHRFECGPQGVSYRSRMLQTQALREAGASGRAALGGFHTPVGHSLLGRLRTLPDPTRTDNGCVVMSRCGTQWLALTESDRMQRFDPHSLASGGELRWQDGLKLPLQAAHPQLDARGRWWNVGIEMGPSCHYVLFSSDGAGRRIPRARIPVKRPGYLHEFALTASRAVIWECAWRAHPLRFLFSAGSYADHFDWLPDQGSRLHVVDLDSGAVQTWDAPPLLAFHSPQAFDHGADLVLDLCLSDTRFVDEFRIAALRAGRPTSAPLGEPMRFVLSPGRADAVQQPLPGRFDLPSRDRRGVGAAEVVWGASVCADTPGAFFNRTLRIDLAHGELREHARADAVMLEPLFVPEPGAAPGQGVLLVPTLADSDPGSVILLLDSTTLEERARLSLPFVIPFGFHAAFEPAAQR